MDNVIVTEVDREAAADFYEGPCTEGMLAICFAHHRIEAARQLEADKAELVEVIKAMAEADENQDTCELQAIAKQALAKYGEQHD